MKTIFLIIGISLVTLITSCQSPFLHPKQPKDGWQAELRRRQENERLQKNIRKALQDYEKWNKNRF